MTTILVFFAAHWFLSAFVQSLFLHRYASHGQFKLSPFWEKFFYILTFVAQGPSFLNPRAYAILHKMHHAYSDDVKDPHSPHQSTNIFKMMWKTALIYDDILKGRVKPEPRFDKEYPVFSAIDWFSSTWVSRLTLGALITFVYFAFVPMDALWLYALLPLQWIMGPIHGAMVNWGGHKYGYRNYKHIRDESKNTLPIDFLIGGELYQNNHHAAQNSPNFARKWWEIDTTYAVMRVLNFAGIIELKQRKPSLARTKSVARTGELAKAA